MKYLEIQDTLGFTVFYIIVMYKLFKSNIAMKQSFWLIYSKV